MKSLVVIAWLAVPAAADVIDPPPRSNDATSLVGFGLGGGKLPGHDLDAGGIDVDVEHRLVGGWRLFGQYEYLFIGKRDENDAATANAMLADGSGHRVQLGLRHSVARTRVLFEKLRFFVDAELGGGLLVGTASEDASGEKTLIDAHAFLGVRAGYDMIRMREDTRASPIWEPSLWFRVLAADRDRLGYMFGLGMAWGD